MSTFGLPTQYTTEPDHAADQITIRETSPTEPERKIIFLPRERGGFLKREEVWQPTAGKWHIVARDVIKHLAVQDVGIEGRVIIEEMQRHGPDRRMIYEPTEDGFTKRETAWRESINGWYEMGTKDVSNLAVELPDD